LFASKQKQGYPAGEELGGVPPSPVLARLELAEIIGVYVMIAVGIHFGV